jgi:hypothetical protein
MIYIYIDITFSPTTWGSIECSSAIYNMQIFAVVMVSDIGLNRPTSKKPRTT